MNYRPRMTARLWVSTIGLAMFATFASRNALSTTGDEAEIRATVERWDAAYNAHKTEDFLAFYLPNADLITFQDALPFQTSGRDEFRKHVDAIFKPTLNVHEVTTVEKVLADANLATVVCTVRSSWSDKSRNISEVLRGTITFEKLNGKWLIAHEHFSVPYDTATMKAVLDAKP